MLKQQSTQINRIQLEKIIPQRFPHIQTNVLANIKNILDIFAQERVKQNHSLHRQLSQELQASVVKMNSLTKR